MTNITAASASESLVGSVAAAAISPSSTLAQREGKPLSHHRFPPSIDIFLSVAALKYLAAMITIGSPVAPPASDPAPPASSQAEAPATAPGAPGPPSPPPPPAVAPPLERIGPFYAGVLYKTVPAYHITDIGIHDNGEGWYGVFKGKLVGITQDHAEALQAVVGVSNNGWKGFKTLAAALFAFNHALDLDIIEVRPLTGRRCPYAQPPSQPRAPNFPDPTFMTDRDLQRSARAYSDEEFAALISTLRVSGSSSPPTYRRTTTPPRPTAPAPTTSTPPPPTPTRGKYYFESPTKRGYTDSWATAGAATQGVAGAHVQSLQKSKSKKRKPKSAAYAVFCGRNPGVFPSWPLAAKSTQGASGSIYRGYPTVPEADAAFEYAKARSWTRVCSSRPSSPSHAPIASVPLPCEESARPNPLHGSETIDQTWYVVYHGISPGVYHSILEALLNTVGVPNQRYEAVTGKAEAFRKYRAALGQRETTSAAPPSYHSST
ncbi:hypothetical protein C8R47DRAFT_1226632 [Mycena vitilis]|nr:hypothetical protein C8R47DRAFT_1226632 [Mycena vitilis]